MKWGINLAYFVTGEKQQLLLLLSNIVIVGDIHNKVAGNNMPLRIRQEFVIQNGHKFTSSASDKRRNHKYWIRINNDSIA